MSPQRLSPFKVQDYIKEPQTDLRNIDSELFKLVRADKPAYSLIHQPDSTGFSYSNKDYLGMQATGF